MKDFNFRDRLIEHPFRGNSFYTYYGKISGSLLWNKKEYTPFIMTRDYTEHENGYLTICTERQFRGKVVTKDKLMEILNTAEFPLRILVGAKYYHIGKGYIGKDIQSTNTKPLLVYTVPYNYQDNDMMDVTLLVDPHYKEEERTIKLIIDHCIKEAVGDVITTVDIAKFITGELKLPKHATISAKKQFDQQFVDKLITTL